MSTVKSLRKIIIQMLGLIEHQEATIKRLKNCIAGLQKPEYPMKESCDAAEDIIAEDSAPLEDTKCLK